MTGAHGRGAPGNGTPWDTERAGGVTVGEAGEFSVIRRITSPDDAPAAGPVPRGPQVGPGDDSAVVAQPDGRVVAAADMLVEGRHFRTGWSGPEDIGAKAVAQNGADIAAMGAVCTGILMSLGCPAQTAVRDVEGIARGARDEAAALGTTVIGGDLVQASRIVVSVTALGDLQGRGPVLRSGARPGDAVAVAGRLGASAAGLALLEAGWVEDGFARQRPALDTAAGHVLVEAHRRPRPPYSAGPRAARAGATAMIDVSDGLVADCIHVAQASGVRLDLDSAALAPGGLVAAPGLAELAQALDVDPHTWILGGGEDHALVATFPQTCVPDGWVVIGSVLGPAAVGASGGGASGVGESGDGPGGDVLVDGARWAGQRGWTGFGG